MERTSQNHLDQTGTSIFHSARELSGEFFNRGCAARLDAHAGSKLDPVKFRIMQIEHRKGLGPGIASPHPREFDVEDRIGAIGEDQRGDVELFSRLRLQRLQRVHRSTIAVETDNLPV